MSFRWSRFSKEDFRHSVLEKEVVHRDSIRTDDRSYKPYQPIGFFSEENSRLEAWRKNTMSSVYPPPRMPVTNEGLGWDSLLKM